jgi:4-alpha-glucanotransferase
MAGNQIRTLHQLARLYGVETVYRDVTGRYRQAAPHSLLAVLQALGAPVQSLVDVPEALRERRQEQWQRSCAPVVVSWKGEPACLELRLPAEQAEVMADCRLELENNGTWCWTCNLASLPVLQVALVEGMSYVSRQLTLPPGLPWGYHRFTLGLPGHTPETLVISAPLQAYALPAGAEGRLWGVFLPLYALHSRQSWGAGDFTDLASLLRWVHGLGGNLVGTLPLLAAFLDEPFAPSPYLPVSRLFWNEFYLDVGRIEELKTDLEAQALLNAPAFQDELAVLRAASLVDYRRVMAVKRKVLERLAHSCFTGDSGRQSAFRHWVAEHPMVQDYARFRATVERQRAGWPAWPGQMREGVLQEGNYDPEAERYHLYVQWLAYEQFQALSEQVRQTGQRLYLDLPLGVHRAGYDVWRERSIFALEASCGAPPDAFFDKGQEWGFPPLHPERIREQGYRYYIACLRHHFRHAGILRLDHVMGLHHLFWVPRGLAAYEGVYVRYHAEEFYALLALESQRHRALIIGEDLGTVPGYVRKAMARHKIYRMCVLPFTYTQNSCGALRPVPTDALVCLNTHDLPTFASFWLEKEKNIADWLTLPVFLHHQGWLDVPTNEVEAVFKSCLAYLAASRARLLLVNLEDLWLETNPQNVPGTGEECPNWQRKARYALEIFTRKSEILELLQKINQLRRSSK